MIIIYTAVKLFFDRHFLAQKSWQAAAECHVHRGTHTHTWRAWTIAFSLTVLKAEVSFTEK